MIFKRLFLSISLGLLISCSLKSSDEIIISNTLPRIDETGEIVDAHDGRIIQFGDRFYWYGTTYGNTNGFTPANSYHCYSSADMVSWRKEGKLLPDQPEGVYYRPHVIYNAPTKKYVLWYNWYPQLWDGQFGVATSDRPEGPFEIVNDNVKMANSHLGLGDFGLFVDEDGVGYISYNTINNHQVSVEKLNDDFLSSTMENGGIIAQHMEAGTIFKNEGKYYLLTDYTCCFCNYGSGARVYFSDNPLTGYKFTGNINRHPGRPSTILTDGKTRGTSNEQLNWKEASFDAIELIFKNETTLNELDIYVFTGNRPENCGNVSNPRVHPEIVKPQFEIYKWAKDQWVSLKVVQKENESSALSEQVTLTIENTQASRIKIVPQNSIDSIKSVYINEVKVSLEGSEVTPNEIDAYITGSKINQYPIIPAQQTYVMKLNTAGEEKFIWMGDLWGSASDNVKGHDYQYWSEPLEFNSDGTINPIDWTDQWSFSMD